MAARLLTPAEAWRRIERLAQEVADECKLDAREREILMDFTRAFYGLPDKRSVN